MIPYLYMYKKIEKVVRLLYFYLYEIAITCKTIVAIVAIAPMIQPAISAIFEFFIFFS